MFPPTVTEVYSPCSNVCLYSSYLDGFQSLLISGEFAHSVSLLHLSGIRCQASLQCIPTLSGFKTQLKTFLLFRQMGFFTNPGRPFLQQQIVCMSTCLYVCEWCLLARFLFLFYKDLRSIRAIHYYYSFCCCCSDSLPYRSLNRT